MNRILQQLGNIESNFAKELTELQERMTKCEKRVAENSQQLEVLSKKCCTELSKYHYEQEEKIPYVFDAPDRNQYFSGRTRELDELQRILKLDGTEQEKKVCIAAVCGLGGIGKTGLLTEYAHMMEKYYQGGVYWFSAENNDFFKRSVEKNAFKLGTYWMDFDITLTSTLMKFSQLQEPCLVVLDSLDQLDLSPYVVNFISEISKLKVSLAVVILTRRKENLLVEEISGLQKDRCLTLKCLDVEEAKQFLFSRTGLPQDENTNSVAENLAEELGGLPLALEQAGACIKELDCNLSEYLEEYRIKRLELLNSQKAKPISPYESPERLAVHTTWSLNISHIKVKPSGMSAIRLMNAYAFLNATEIEEELVNIGEPPIEDEAFRDCVSSQIGCRRLVTLLTNFSLFTYVHVSTLSTHRLVQEIVRESLGPEEKAQSFVDAVRLLSFAFSRCSSPRSLFGSAGVEERLKTFDFPRNSSRYYLWSKLCFHVFYLQQNMEKLLENRDPKCLDSLFVFETAKILYESVINLSADQKLAEAKCTLNLAYRVLDWVSLSDCDVVEKRLRDGSLSAFLIPLPKWLQIVIKQSCIPPMSSAQPIDGKPGVVHVKEQLKADAEKLKLQGNESFKDGLYKEAIDAYSAAIDMSKGTSAFNPLLLTNRASAYIKLNQKDAALKDANEYIVRFPDCWKGYARKALALDGVSAEIAAALAYYYYQQEDGSCIFTDYQPFKEGFPLLKGRIGVCDTELQFKKLVERQPVRSNTQDYLQIIVLGSNEYILDLESSDHVPSGHFNSERTHPALIVSNCILVGAKCSVKIKLSGRTGFTLENKCMLADLSFSIDQGQITCSPKSFVKVLNCNFTSNSAEKTAVGSQGLFNAERCNFIKCNAGGLLCTGTGSCMTVDGCTFERNASAGLEVREGGKLLVRKSRMYYNKTDGLAIGPKAAECNAFECEMYHNAREGIAIIESSKCVTLMRNDIFGNAENGIYVRNSDVTIRENKIFDNESWGVWSGINAWCSVSMNEVFRNKRGGVRVGKRPAIKELQPSVVDLNKIHDNYGAGYVNNIHKFEKLQFVVDGLLKPNDGNYQSAKFEENAVYNNEEAIIVNQTKFSAPWCSRCFRKNEELKLCSRCFTASYCNTDCQKSHWPKHRKLCKVLREKSSFLITSMENRGDLDDFFSVRGNNLGRDFSPPPPRDGKRFIVKLQTDYESFSIGRPHMLESYDQSLGIDKKFEAKYIEHLVKQFGVLGERRYFEKKLYLYCVFENEKLRLFINDFAPFQTW